MTEFQARLAARRDLTDRISEFTFAPLGDMALPAYEAGAHLRFDVKNGDTRAYSLVGFAPPPAAPVQYVIAVQREDNEAGGSQTMHRFEVGDTVTVTPPKCDFAVQMDHPGTFLAGGIGVTPMITMAATLQAAGQDVSFHYAGRSAGVMAYVSDLTAQFGDDLHLHFDDDPATALDLGAVIGALPPAHHVYICGPRGMIQAARAAAEADGIAGERVHVELFDNGATDAGATGSFEVEIASSGEVFTVGPEQSIIDALEAGGVDVMYDCQRGDCGICQTDVISGDIDHRDVVLSEGERASGKVMQICVSRAKSARLVLDL